MATSTYTRNHSDTLQALGVPYAQPSPQIGAGKKRLVQVKLTSQGRITDVDVYQSDDGSAVAATVDILKSGKAFPINQDVDVGTDPAIPLDFINIVPTINVMAGQHGQLQQDNTGFAFRNIDGTSTNNQRFVYVLITPTSAVAPTTWDISVTVESTVGE